MDFVFKPEASANVLSPNPASCAETVVLISTVLLIDLAHEHNLHCNHFGLWLALQRVPGSTSLDEGSHSSRTV